MRVKLRLTGLEGEGLNPDASDGGEDYKSINLTGFASASFDQLSSLLS